MANGGEYNRSVECATRALIPIHRAFAFETALALPGVWWLSVAGGNRERRRTEKCPSSQQEEDGYKAWKAGDVQRSGAQRRTPRVRFAPGRQPQQPQQRAPRSAWRCKGGNGRRRLRQSGSARPAQRREAQAGPDTGRPLPAKRGALRGLVSEDVFGKVSIPRPLFLRIHKIGREDGDRVAMGWRLTTRKGAESAATGEGQTRLNCVR
jgi:hypothetical protein